MQGNRGNGDPFSGFGDPFAGFGGFGAGFGGQGSMLSNIFGGRDPFDDPFFQRPFGNRPSMFGPSMFGPGNPFGSSMPGMFGPGNSFAGGPAPGFLENRRSQPAPSRGPIIEELNSDDEGDKEDERVGNPRKHARSSSEPYVEDPDDVTEGRSKQMQYMNQFNRANNTLSQPQTHSYSFQSSSVTYGGVDGAYYTSSTTRRTGSDGLTFEEAKEADTTTGQAKHRVSRGLHDKGHTVNRKLTSDGKVDTMQMLHNLNEDELSGFDEAWNGNARERLPGWNGGLNVTSGGPREGNKGRWALPSNEPIQRSQNKRLNIDERAGTSRPQQHSGRMDPGLIDGARASQGRGGRSTAPRTKQVIIE